MAARKPRASTVARRDDRIVSLLVHAVLLLAAAAILSSAAWAAPTVAELSQSEAAPVASAELRPAETIPTVPAGFLHFDVDETIVFETNASEARTDVTPLETDTIGAKAPSF
jgi:hypothetical protein